MTWEIKTKITIIIIIIRIINYYYNNISYGLDTNNNVIIIFLYDV